MSNLQEGAKKVLKRDKVNGMQLKVYFVMITLYLFYYFAKYNMSPAVKEIQGEFGYSSTEFGIVFTVYTLVYAAGQFINGFLGDRYGAKSLMVIGALGAVAANFLFGFAGALTFFVIFWALNAYFLSMGWAPGCNILFKWLPEERWGTFMGGYNAFCYLGGALVYPLAGWVVANWGWRASFYVIPLFTAAMAIIFLFTVKDSPKAAGYEVEWEQNKEEEEVKVGRKEYLMALTHPKMNVAYLCDVCANLVRWGLLNWMVKILSESRDIGGFGLTVVMAATVGSLMHWGGAFFSIALGWMQDKFFGGERWQTISIGFFVSAGSLFLLAKGPSMLDMSGGMLLLCAAMFFGGGVIQGVQAPLFNIPGDVLGRRLGGTGSGIMNGWGYVGAALAGVGLGSIMDNYGFLVGITVLSAICILGGVLAVFLRTNKNTSASDSISG